MTTRIWEGDQPAVAQVDTIVIGGAWLTGETATITVNGKSITFTVAATQTVAAVVAGLVAAWNASTIPEVAEMTAADANPNVTLTADTAGRPFTITCSEASATGTITPSTTTANAGPNVWAAANFSGDTLPTGADDVVFENSASDCKYGLDQNAVTLATLIIRPTFTGKIGLPRTNADAAVTYIEYRDAYLKIGATALTIEDGEGNGSGRLKINTGSVQTTLNVHSSGTALETGVEPILWKGTHASNVVNVTRGRVGIAVFAGETAVVATLRMGYKSAMQSDAQVRCGSGVTLTTINKTGGILEIRSNVTTLTDNGGQTTIQDAATVGTLTSWGGSIRYRSSGTLTAGTIGKGGELDCRQDMRPRTITNLTLYAGAKYYDPFETVTHTNAFAVKCALADVTLDLGYDFTLQRA